MFFVPLIEKYLSNAIHKFEFCTPKLSIGIQIADYSDYNLFRIICDESSSGVCNGSSLSFFFFFSVGRTLPPAGRMRSTFIC